MENNENGRKKEPFVTIDPDQLPKIVQILKSRLPRSAHVYNMALGASFFPSIKCYSLDDDLSENGIFVLIDIRQDYNQDINISVPLDFKVTEKVKQDFIATSIIDWKSQYWFPLLDRQISFMIFEISVVYKENTTTMNPVYYHYMGAEEAANLELKWSAETEVKPLNSKEGVDLVTKGWKWSREGTTELVQDIMENGKTSAVYVDGKPVCGILLNKNGYLGMLFTAKDHRNKGYGRICTQFLMKQLGKDGFVIASGVECFNKASKEFHKRIGLKFSHMVDDIIYEKEDNESK